MGNFWQDLATAHEHSMNRPFRYEGQELEARQGHFQKPRCEWMSLAPPPAHGKGAPTERAPAAAVLAAALTDIVRLIKPLHNDVAGAGLRVRWMADPR